MITITTEQQRALFYASELAGPARTMPLAIWEEFRQRQGRALASRVAPLNPDAGEIGAGRLKTLVDDARRILNREGKA